MHSMTEILKRLVGKTLLSGGSIKEEPRLPHRSQFYEALATKNSNNNNDNNSKSKNNDNNDNNDNKNNIIYINNNYNNNNNSRTTTTTISTTTERRPPAGCSSSPSDRLFQAHTQKKRFSPQSRTLLWRRGFLPPSA